MKNIVLNLETGKYEEVKPPKRPTCCVPGCERKAHNKVGGGGYEPRTDTGYKNRFGGRGYVCSKHWSKILMVRNDTNSPAELTAKNKLKREELAPKGTLY